MSYVFYNPNDLVYVRDIGYGKLINCGKFNSVSFKNDMKHDNDDSDDQFYFDPRLFLLPGQQYDDEPQLKEESKQEQMPVASEKEKQKQKNKKGVKDIARPINIVTVQLQGNQAMVHTSSQNIRKHVSLSIKPMFSQNKDIQKIQIQINKTIESLKKLIFQKMGLKIAFYYNIKLYSTTPYLTQLSVHSKTITQYALKEQSNIIVVAQHGFCFQQIPQQYREQFSLSNNEMTFISNPKKVKVQQKKPQIKQVGQVKQVKEVQQIKQVKQVQEVKEVSEQKQINGEGKQEQKNVNNENNQNKQQNLREENQKEQNNKENGSAQSKQEKPKEPQVNQNKPIQDKQKQVQPQQIKPQQIKPEKVEKPEQKKEKAIEKEDPKTVLQLKCDQVFSSGKGYWQIKIDRVLGDFKQILIGFVSETGENSWSFNPLSSKKKTLQGKDAEQKEYGLVCKQDDTVGVFLQFSKNKKASITYYKNNVCLGTCFENIEGRIRPFAGLGGNCQVSLFSRVDPPIDSYRKN